MLQDGFGNRVLFKFKVKNRGLNKWKVFKKRKAAICKNKRLSLIDASYLIKAPPLIVRKFNKRRIFNVIANCLVPTNYEVFLCSL